MKFRIDQRVEVHGLKIELRDYNGWTGEWTGVKTGTQWILKNCWQSDGTPPIDMLGSTRCFPLENLRRPATQRVLRPRERGVRTGMF